MSQHYTDFSGYTVAAAPSDWTLRFGGGTWQVVADAAATGGKVLRRSGDSTLDFLTWDAVDSDAARDEVDVAFKVKVSAATGTEMRAVLRGSNSSGKQGYVHGIRPDSSSANLSKFTAGTFGDLSSTAGITFTPNVWYWVRAQQRGVNCKVKYWLDSDTQPAAWTVESSDSGITGVGWVGLYSNRDSVVDIDVFSVGTGTDNASLIALATGPDYTQRKGSTFTATHTLGTITTATLNAAAITINTTGAGTVNLTDTSGITTSGEYNLILGDGAATETYTVQLNVYGVVPSNNPAQKDGSALASLTGVQIRITAGANLNGTQVYYSPTETTDASGNFSTLDVSTSAAVAADPVLMQVLTAAGDSITSAETVELI
jgi:hypothetical protein